MKNLGAIALMSWVTLGCSGGEPSSGAESADDRYRMTKMPDGTVLCGAEHPVEGFPRFYRFETMNADLLRNADLETLAGVSKVESCEQAEQYVEARNALDDSLAEVLPAVPDAEPEVLTEEPEIDKIYGGSVVTGAGPSQQYEGIMRLAAGSTYCSGVFLTDRHILTSAHCFNQGVQRVLINAPGFSGNDPTASVILHPAWQPGVRSCDLAIVTTTRAVAWATTARRFRFYSGSISAGRNLHIYGYGGSNYHVPGDGNLRHGNNQVTIDSAPSGYFTADAQDSRGCHGDSGGPALREGVNASGPVVWGVFSGWNGDTNDQCPVRGADLIWTKVNTNGTFITDMIQNTPGYAGVCQSFSDGDGVYWRCF